MKIGTRSVLFGAHCFFLHPWFVAAAWRKLYGFPRDPRLWVAFFVHDLGYLGKPNMDGAEGERHVEFGARLMRFLFGAAWGEFTLYHSRYYAKLHGRPFSRLCVADKFSISLEPAWLYLPRVLLSGEAHEYMTRDERQHSRFWVAEREDPRKWFHNVQQWCRAWALEHRDEKPDTWTVI